MDSDDTGARIADLIIELRELAGLSPEDQKEYRDEIDAAWQALIDLKPSRKAFSFATNGLVLTGGMLWDVLYRSVNNGQH